MNVINTVNLKTEYAVNPIGIDNMQPRLSWQLESEQKSQRQSAYRVLVATCEENLNNELGDMWDTGKVVSGQSINIQYKGHALESTKRYYWKVCVWDSDGCQSAYSQVSWWEMGLLYISDWKAEWIGLTDDETGRLPLFRHTFEIPKPIKRARAYICGLGHYELYLSGKKIGDSFFDPGWTNYSRTCFYSAYDVTDELLDGANAIGVILGNGMYNVRGGRYSKFTGTFGLPRLILRLKCDFTDGSSLDIISNDEWRAGSSPITFSCIFGGEDYDARLEDDGWSTPEFLEGPEWKQASILDLSKDTLKAQTNPPIKIMKTFCPISMEKVKKGSYLIDFGQNFSGWVHLTVKGKKGSKVRIVPSEILKNGSIYQKCSGEPYYLEYILKGDGEEKWRPRFSYYGFRYALVEGAIPQKDVTDDCCEIPVLLDIEGEMLYPDVETIGRFICSNPLLNSIHGIINQAVLSNMKSILTDCPHREKIGWLEQVHLMAPSIMFNYDVALLYTKIIDDMSEAQLENGLIPDIAPEFVRFEGGFRDSPEWGSAYIIAAWYFYERTGDKTILEKHYTGMKKYFDYLSRCSRDHILTHGLGDWCDIGPNPPYAQNTPVSLTATAIYYYDAIILQKIAGVLGKSEEVRFFATQAQIIKQSYNNKFFCKETSNYAEGSQTANGISLALGLVEKDYESAVLNNIVADIRQKGNHTTSGDIGFKYVLQALIENNRSDVVMDMLMNTDNPSYGYQIVNGATSLTEKWDGPTAEDCSSQNHLMLGHAEEWFYRCVAGIHYRFVEGAENNIVLKPEILKGIEWAEACHELSYGRLEVNWKRLDNGGLQIDVTIPANTYGTVYLPKINASSLIKSGLENDSNVRLFQEDASYWVVGIGSGKYSFIIGD